MSQKYNETFREVLKVLQKNSTCIRKQVGTVIVKSDRIIGTGWNGVPSGFKHCNEIFHIVKQPVPFGNYDPNREPNKYYIHGIEVTKEHFMHQHHDFSEKQELHSELNAIICLAKNGVSPEGAEMYTTLAPCSNCAKAILAAGIKKLYYMEEYDRSSEGLDLLKEAQQIGKIELEKI